MTSTPAATFGQWFDPRFLAGLSGLDLKARYIVEGFLQGLHDSPFHGFSVEFSDYRTYQPGDDLRHLDWRLYARSDRLCIKRYMQETNARFYLVCDSSGSMGYRGTAAWGSKLDCAKALGAALTWFLLKQNDAAGMLGLVKGQSLEYVQPSQRSSQFGMMLRQLESLAPAGGACLSQLLKEAARLVHRRSIILFLSDLLEPAEALSLGFEQLRFLGHEIIVFQILDKDEIDFPFTEAKLFEDPETGARRSVSPEAAREKYLERFRDFMSAHYEVFRRLEIPHCTVRTDQNPWHALTLFLRERKKRP